MEISRRDKKRTFAMNNIRIKKVSLKKEREKSEEDNKLFHREREKVIYCSYRMTQRDCSSFLSYIVDEIFIADVLLEIFATDSC